MRVALLLAVPCLLATLVVGPATMAGADTAVSFPVSCDRPNTGITPGLFVNLNTEIPDPIGATSVMQVTEGADPVLSGQAAQFDLALPFPDFSSGFPPNDYGVTYGTVFIKSVDITVPIPSGLNVNTVSPTEVVDKNYVTVSRSGSNIVVHVQSAVSGSRIRINTEVASPVAEVETSSGVWTPVVMPAIHINPTVSGAPGSSIVWKPPSLSNVVVKWNKDFGLLIGKIDWNDLSMPCTPNDPNQAIATTSVGAPGLSVSTSAEETAVVAGSPVHVHVTATNTGDVPLTGVVITDANAPGCAASPGSLAVGAHVTLDCTVTTSAANIPTYSNSAGADSNETAPVSSNTATVTVASVASTGIAGKLTESGTGTAIAGGWVAAMRTSDFALAGGAVADAAGNYKVNLPAGQYYLYVIDPTGRHASGFHGAPASASVTVGSLTAVDHAMAPNRGTIAGTVTEQGTGTPVPGALVLTLSSGGVPEAMATADGSGRYSLGDVRTGAHLVAFVDPSGGHAPEFFGDSANPSQSTRVTVTGGATSTANGTPPAQAVAGTGSTITGTVTENGTNAPLSGVSVIAMRASDYGLVRVVRTDANGGYVLNLPAGSYKLVFLDGAGTHYQEWFDNQPYYGIAAATTVVAPGLANAVLDRTAGTMAGTISDDPSGAPLTGAWVVAIGSDGVAGGAVTAADGHYAIPGLAAGTYRAAIVDPNGGRTQEYWNNATTFADAAPVTIAGGATTTIDAALHHP